MHSWGSSTVILLEGLIHSWKSSGLMGLCLMISIFSWTCSKVFCPMRVAKKQYIEFKIYFWGIRWGSIGWIEGGEQPLIRIWWYHRGSGIEQASHSWVARRRRCSLWVGLNNIKIKMSITGCLEQWEHFLLAVIEDILPTTRERFWHHDIDLGKVKKEILLTGVWT
jgi:hypothetical protein